MVTIKESNIDLELNISAKDFLFGSSAYALNSSITTAISLNLFTLIRDRGPVELSDLAKLLQVNVVGLDRLLTVLSSQSLINYQNNKVFLNKFISMVLSEDMYESFTSWIHSCNKFKSIWKNIETSISLDYCNEDRKNTQFWAEAYKTPESSLITIKAFEWLARLTGLRLSEIVSTDKPHSVLDIGTGSGGAILQYLSKKTGAVGIGIDLEDPLNFFTDLAMKLKVEDRVDFINEDMHKIVLGRKFDIIILSWMLHNLSNENSINLLNRAKEHLTHNGCIFVVETINKPESLYSSMLSMEMYLSTGEGKERSFKEFVSIFNEVGLKTECIHENYDYRKIIVLKDKKYISPPKPERITLSNKLKQLDVSFTSIFGDQSLHRTSDIDIAIVLKTNTDFHGCLVSMVSLIKEIHKWDLSYPITPSLELYSLLNIEKPPVMQLLLYPDFWIFERLESPGVKNAIMASADRSFANNTYRPQAYIEKYFDLLTKVANSLVLLLNQDPINRKLAERHALKIARYVKEWAPIDLPIPPERFTFEDALLFYSNNYQMEK